MFGRRIPEKKDIPTNLAPGLFLEACRTFVLVNIRDSMFGEEGILGKFFQTLDEKGEADLRFEWHNLVLEVRFWFSEAGGVSRQLIHPAPNTLIGRGVDKFLDGAIAPLVRKWNIFISAKRLLSAFLADQRMLKSAQFKHKQ